ncbi:MAG: hypothetical protein JWP87_1105 [Labilithrix sp.]|nr:hypothetical protein [Labilithrix sp.]
MTVTWSGEAPESASASGPNALTSAHAPAPESGIQVVAVRLASAAAATMDFAELYRAHFSYVWKTARRLGVNPGEVDDVVQETFLTAHRLLDAYEALGSYQSWLFSILFRVVQRHRRSQRRRTALTSDGLDVEAFAGSSARAPDKNAEHQETVRVLEEILDTLDADRRAVLVLADLEEKPIAEIAEILGINVNTAASRLRVAREHVEASMARHRARDGWRFK